VEGIAASLIATGIAQTISATASTAYDGIRSKVTDDDQQRIENEFVEALDTRLAGSAELQTDDIREIVQTVDDRGIDSIYQSKDEIADQVAKEIHRSGDMADLSTKSSLPTLVAEAIDEAIQNWMEDISGEERVKKYILESTWETESQVKQLRDELGASVESQSHYHRIDVSEYENPAEVVSKYLESGRPLTADVFINRPEIPERVDEEKYLITGRRGMGKTRTLDYLQTRLIDEQPIAHVLLPDEGLMSPPDAEEFADTDFDGDVLLLWDDIQDLQADKQEGTVRTAIAKLSHIVEQSGTSLYVVATLRAEFRDEIPHIHRADDRVWSEFERVNLTPLNDDEVVRLCEAAIDVHGLRLSDRTQAALIREIQYTDPSPLYIETAISSIDESQEIQPQIEDLPDDVEEIWASQYQRLVKEHPNTRFILWSIELLRLGAVPPYEPTLRRIYSEVFDRDRFSFQDAVRTLRQRQWIWEGSHPYRESSVTRYDTRAAQMSAVSEDHSRIIDDYVEFLQGSFPETVPDEDDDWVPVYYSNYSMTFMHEVVGDTSQYVEPLLEKAVELDPYNPTIRNNYATYHQIRGKPREAIDHYEVALSVSPAWADLRSTYAATLDELGEHYKAKQEYERVIESDAPQPQAQFNLATLMYEFGQHEQAIHHYEQARQNGYHGVQLYSNLGALYKGRGDYLEGIELLQKGLELLESQSSQAGADELEAGELQLLNQGPTAGEVMDPQLALRVNLGSAFVELERYDEARDTVEPLLENHANHSRVHGVLSLAYSHLGNRKKAVYHAKEAQSADNGQNPLDDGYLEGLEVIDVRESPEWQEKPDLLRVVDQNLQEENYPKAYDQCHELIEVGHTSSEVYLRLADIAKELNYVDEAEKYYQEAIEADPENGHAYHHYGNFLKHQQRFDEAKERFETGIRVSDEPEIHNDYGLLLVQNGDAERGAEVLASSLEKLRASDDAQADEAQALHNYAQALFHSGEIDEARRRYTEAIEKDPEYPEPRMGLGNLEAYTGNIDEGIEHLDDALPLFEKAGKLEKWTEALRLAIRNLERAGRTKEALNKCNYGLETLQEIGAEHMPVARALSQIKRRLQED